MSRTVFATKIETTYIARAISCRFCTGLWVKQAVNLKHLQATKV
jgi:hypothetical protein